ncbi:MAG: hypothetical protein LBG59_03470 [Candidatus Peribacteria bacterium]|nr:hypothetical protein [Candidatus Peribacteria bacterium]
MSLEILIEEQHNFIIYYYHTMLQTLTEAKAYATDSIAQLQERTLPPEEKMYIEDMLEELFMEKISQLVSEEELEKANATTIEALEGRLFYHLPNYVTLLEETTAEFMASYLIDDDEEGEEEFELDENEEAQQEEKPDFT